MATSLPLASTKRRCLGFKQDTDRLNHSQDGEGAVDRPRVRDPQEKGSKIGLEVMKRAEARLRGRTAGGGLTSLSLSFLLCPVCPTRSPGSELSSDDEYSPIETIETLISEDVDSSVGGYCC